MTSRARAWAGRQKPEDGAPPCRDDTTLQPRKVLEASHAVQSRECILAATLRPEVSTGARRRD